MAGRQAVKGGQAAPEIVQDDELQAVLDKRNDTYVNPYGVEKVTAKILAVMKKVESVESSKMTQGPKYNYISEAVLTKAIREAFLEVGLVVFPEDIGLRTQVLHDVDRDGKDRNVVYTEGTVRYKIVDTESGQSITVAGSSAGQDFGDKSVNKAMTGAYKMMQRQVFMIPSPERDDPDSTPSIRPQGQQQQPNKMNDPGTIVIKFHDKYQGKTIAEVWAIDKAAILDMAANSKSDFMRQKCAAYASAQTPNDNPFN